MRESKIEGDVCAYARRTGWLAFKFVSPGHRSVPDRMFISKTGKVCFIEFKAPGAKPTVLQEREIGILKSRGLPVIWTSSVREGKEFLDFINK